MRREPSVPPRIEVRHGSRPARRIASSADSISSGCSSSTRFMFVYWRRTVTSTRRARVRRGDLGCEPAHQRLVCRELLLVEVAGDHHERRLGRVPLDEIRMDEAVPPVGRLGRERLAGERGDEVGGELDGVDQLPLREARVHAHAGEADGRLERREGLVLDLARGRAVEGERRCGTERLEVEELRAVPDLLVGREGDPERPVRELGVRDEVLDGGHDLGHAGLVVGPEQRRPVGRDQVVADVVAQLRELRGVEREVRIGRQRRPGRRRSRVTSCGFTFAPLTAGLVSTCAIRPSAGTSWAPSRAGSPSRSRARRGARRRARSLSAPRPGDARGRAASRGGIRVGALGRLRVDHDVAQEALERGLSQLGRERRGVPRIGRHSTASSTAS